MIKHLCASILLAFIVATSAHALTSAADAGGYTMIDSNEVGGPTFSYEDISITPINTFMAADDGVRTNVPLGFTLRFYGTDYTKLYISSNGFLSFDANHTFAWDNTVVTVAGDKIPFTMPFDPLNVDAYSTKTLPTAYVAPNFVDQDPYTDTNAIYHETRGTAPYRRFIVQYRVPQFYYTSATSVSDPYDYEVIFYETTNDIVFQYKKIENNLGWTHDPYTTNGAAATVGIQGSASSGTSYQSGASDLTWGMPISLGANSGVLSNGLAVRFNSPIETLTSNIITTPTTTTTTSSLTESGGGCLAPLAVQSLPTLLLLIAGILWMRRRQDS